MEEHFDIKTKPMYCGSFSLYIRGLLNRKPHDIDVVFGTYNKNVINFLKKVNIKLDWLCSFGDWTNEYDIIKRKNYYIKVQKLHIVILIKYLFQKRQDAVPHIVYKKHENGLIDLFKKLGKEKSLNEISKLENIKEVSEYDLNDLKTLIYKTFDNE